MLALALRLGLVVAIVVAGIAIERYVELTDVRAALPTTVRTLIALVSFGVLGGIPFVEGVAVPVLDDTVAAIAAFAVLWIGLPLLAAQFVGRPGPPGRVDHHGCDR